MFNRYVVAQRQFSTARPLLIGGAAVLHGLLLVGLVIYSVVRVEEMNAPPLLLTWIPMPPPPAPPPKGTPDGGKAPRRPSTMRAPRATPTPTPTPVQPAVAETRAVTTDATASGPVGEAGGSDVGVTGGKLGGIPGGVPAATAPTPAPARPRNVPPHEMEQLVLVRPTPHLPDIVKLQRRGTGLAMWKGIQCIDTAGNVTSTRVLVAIPGADEAIVATLREWKYKPVPVPLCSMIELEFDIEQ